MGYYTRISGEIHIDPPITYGELVAAEYDLSELKLRGGWLPLDGGWEIGFDVDREEVNTGEGVLTTYVTDTITPSDDETKAYNLTKCLEDVVATFGNHSFTGTLLCYGEEGGDIWRVVVGNGEVLEQHPELRWPTGETTKLR